MLNLGDGSLSFTALDNGTLWKRHRLALERAAQRQGLSEQLKKGSVEVFDAPLSDVRELNVGRGIAFGTFKILVGNVRYLFHEANPQQVQFHDITEVIELARRLFEGISAFIEVKA